MAAAKDSTSARAKTRSQSGITVPRKVELAADEPKSTKANTSKPRTQTVAGGRVAKKPAKEKKVPAAKGPKKVVKKVEGAVNGAVEKAEGAVEKKPGKKAAGTAKVRGTKAPTKAKATKK